MKTAMQQVIKQIKQVAEDTELNEMYRAGLFACAARIKLSLEDEKEQLIEAYYAGTAQFSNEAEIIYPKTPEDYYNETYGNEAAAS